MKRYMRLLCFVAAIPMVLAACSAQGGQSQETVGQAQNSGGSGSETNVEKITLKLADSVPSTGAFSQQGIQPFMKRVTELTNGQVEFEHYPSEQLGKAQDLFQLTSDGVTDIAYVTAGVSADKIPLANLVTVLPGIYHSSYQGSMAFHEVVQQSPFIDEYLAHGVRPIFAGTTLPYDIWTKGLEVKVPEDIKGVKVGAGGGPLNELVEFLGGVAVTTTPPGMYESLDRGVIEGYLMHSVIVKDYGTMEIAKYGTQGLNFGGLGFNFVMNEKKWQSLPEHVQEAIQTAGLEAAEGTKTYQDAASEETVEAYKDKVNIYFLSEEAQQKWQAEYDKFVEKKVKEFEEKGLKAQEAIDMMKKAAEKYE